MQANRHDTHDVVEHLDADAVCELCGNVNPEGTLLCKQCGNNLRDQRSRRMHATGGPTSTVESSFSVSRIVRGVVIVFGICAVLWVALNVSTIETWLMSGVQSAEAKSANAVAPEEFWSGADAARYEALSAALREHVMTAEEAGLTAPGSPLALPDGRYVLKRSTDPAASPSGSAIVKSEGEKVYFVAQLFGGTEVRGEGLISSDTILQAPYIGILDPDGTFSEAYGLAQIKPSGELECEGFFGAYERPASIVAIPVPDSAADADGGDADTGQAEPESAAPAETETAPETAAPSEPAAEPAPAPATQ
ncbi:MAG: hypothetical protein IT367_13420 [Candidatus Hydrogenedentes bacterium]|nr:hypothetical protein [Candidatus Hydrogenedentota bacterium]